MNWLPLVIIFVLAAAGVAIFLLLKRRSSSGSKIAAAADVVSMRSDAWVISWSPGMPAHPTTLASGWSFDFPTKDGVHMILVPYRATKSHSTVAFTFRIVTTSGTPKFLTVDGGDASVRPMLERTGDMMSPNQEFYRWWSAPTILVADGIIHTATFPLTPDKWTAVFGRSDPTEFAASVKDLMGVGISFGGMYAAHGVYATGGTARFEMLDYKIT